MILRLLPILLVIVLAWYALTASARTARQLRATSKTLADWSILERVKLLERTIGVGRFDVRITPMAAPNAIAAPNGDIYLTKGLYDLYLAGRIERDEITAIVAHEIGHVALGHHARRLDAYRIETAALAAALVALGARVLFGWIGLLGALGLKLARARISRRDEFEADAFAAQLMMRAGLDPQALVKSLERTDGWSAAGKVQGPARWMMSHPSTAERVAALEAVIEAGAEPRSA